MIIHGGHMKRALPENKAELNQLWHNTFGDSEEYINAFYQYHYSEGQVFTWVEEDVIQTVVYAIPARVVIAGVTREARYLYAIATKPEYRGHRNLEKLLAQMKRTLGEECLFLLVPEKGVIPYYESLGFQLNQSFKGITLEKTDRPEGLVTDFGQVETPEEYFEIRLSRLQKRNALHFSQRAINWFLEDLKLADGIACHFEVNGQQELIAGTWDDAHETFKMIETTLSEQNLEKCTNDLCAHLQCEKIIQAPLQYMTDEKIRQRLYVNLALN